MSRLLGNPAHQCYVYPDFDKALERFAAGGIGPFFVLDEVGELPLGVQVKLLLDARHAGYEQHQRAPAADFGPGNFDPVE